MVEHPRGDNPVIAGERPGDVLDALAGADAELGRLDIDRVSAELGAAISIELRVRALGFSK